MSYLCKVNFIVSQDSCLILYKQKKTLIFNWHYLERKCKKKQLLAKPTMIIYCQSKTCYWEGKFTINN